MKNLFYYNKKSQMMIFFKKWQTKVIHTKQGDIGKKRFFVLK